MADQRINVPPPSGNINLNVGNTLTAHAAQACQLCCSIGDHFSPDITNITLSQGDNVFTAVTPGSGTYNTSDLNTPCNPSGGVVLNAKSVQINP